MIRHPDPALQNGPVPAATDPNSGVAGDQLAWPIVLFCLLLVSLSLLILTVFLAAHEQDRLSISKESKTLSSVINVRLTNLASTAKDNAIWSEGYENVVIKYSPDWVAGNYTSSLWSNFKINKFLIVDPENHPLYYLKEGMKQPVGEGIKLLDPDVSVLIAKARAVSTTPPKPAMGFIVTDGLPNLAVAIRVWPEMGPFPQHKALSGTVLVFLTVLTDEYLDQIEDQFGFSDLEARPLSVDRRKATAALALPGMSGAPIALVTWRHADSGLIFLNKALPLTLFTGFFALVFGGLALFRLRANFRKQLLAERQLRSALRAASAGNVAKAQFLATMSHELRTPLNAIIGFSELMEREELGPIANTRYHEYSGIIYNSGLHLLAIINDVLDLSKIEAGRFELSRQEFQIGYEIMQSVMLLSAQSMQSGVTLHANTTIGDGPRLFADQRRIRQVLFNLLSNAIKFTPKGGAVSIDVSFDPTRSLRITIADSGIGMASENIPIALEYFRQIDSGELSRKYQGTGLGLPLSKHLLELHGGNLTIESRLGQGTTAIIDLPPSCVVGSGPNL